MGLCTQLSVHGFYAELHSLQGEHIVAGVAHRVYGNIMHTSSSAENMPNKMAIGNPRHISIHIHVPPTQTVSNWII